MYTCHLLSKMYFWLVPIELQWWIFKWRNKRTSFQYCSHSWPRTESHPRAFSQLFLLLHKARKYCEKWEAECSRISQPHLYRMFHIFSIIGLCWSLTSGNQLCHPSWKSACLLQTIFQLKCLSLPVMGSSSFYGLLCSSAHCPFHTQLPPQLHFRLISRTCWLIPP